MSVSTQPTEDQRAVVRQFLQLGAESVQADLEKYRRSCQTRNRYIENARQIGMTYREIGEHLGISEAAVRGLLKRAGE